MSRIITEKIVEEIRNKDLNSLTSYDKAILAEINSTIQYNRGNKEMATLYAIEFVGFAILALLDTIEDANQ